MLLKEHGRERAGGAERSGIHPPRCVRGVARLAIVGLSLPLLALGSACGDAPPRVTAEGGGSSVSAEAGEGQNAPPEIGGLFFEPARLRPGGEVTARADVYDPEGDTTWIDYRWTVDGQPRAERSPTLSLRGVPKGAQITVRAVARDGYGESAPRELSDRVVNTPPTITALRLNTGPEIQPGEELMAQAEGEDPDGDTLSFQYRWLVDGVPQPGAEDVFATTSLQRGARVRVVVVPDDGEASGEPWRSEEVTLGNRPPDIVSHPERAGHGGEDFLYAIEARDPDGDKNLRYELVEAPAGMTLDPISGLLRWRPGLDQAGDHQVVLAVSDPHGGKVEQHFVIPVTIENRLQSTLPPTDDAGSKREP